MTLRRSCLASVLVCVLSSAPAVLADQDAGRISGRVSREQVPLAGVQVVIAETGAAQRTSTDGTYAFTGLRPGVYTLVFTLSSHTTTQVATLDGESPAVLDVSVDWPLSFVEELVVEAASRQVERAIDAPAPVIRLEASDARRLSGQAQVPRLVAYAPGVQVAQSGLYDFNVNARGFNDLVNRRVRTEVDGRDTSQVAVMGLTMWAGATFPPDEIESLEFVRGAGSALYGAGAFNGVLSIMTKAPAESLGGRARITFGDLDTLRFDARHAGRIGGWGYFKVAGGYQRSRDFARSRVTGTEYAPGQVPLEVIPLTTDRPTLMYGTARIDRPLASGAQLTIEGGTGYSQGFVTTTNLGRYQTESLHQPWVRAKFSSARWRLTTSVTGEDMNNSLGLSSGVGSYDTGYNAQLLADTHRTFGRGRGRLLAGASSGRQSVDSRNPAGVQTIWPARQTVNEGSIFGQLDYEIASRLKISGAARLEASSLFQATLSPRGAMIYSIRPSQTVRVAVARAFKAPTVSETRLQAALAPPLDLSAVEQAFAAALGGARLGFESVPVLAVGNANLKVEEVTGLDLGYSGLVGSRTLLSATYYHNWLSRFTSGLLPQVGTSLGRLNPDFGPYRAPAGVGETTTAAIGAALSAALPAHLATSLTNLDNGAPAFVVLSLGNFGRARTQGLEIGSITMLPRMLRVEASYTAFSHRLTLSAPDVPLLPNTPGHQASAALSHAGPRFDASIRYRWTSRFDWLSGVYAGPVPSYGLTDVQASFPLTTRLRAGVDASNLFDNAHYEMFGGDLIGRRVLGYLTLSWRN